MERAHKKAMQFLISIYFTCAKINSTQTLLGPQQGNYVAICIINIVCAN